MKNILFVLLIFFYSCKKKENCYNCTVMMKNGTTWKVYTTTEECGEDVMTKALSVQVNNKNARKTCHLK